MLDRTTGLMKDSIHKSVFLINEIPVTYMIE